MNTHYQEAKFFIKGHLHSIDDSRNSNYLKYLHKLYNRLQKVRVGQQCRRTVCQIPLFSGWPVCDDKFLTRFNQLRIDLATVKSLSMSPLYSIN